MTYGRPKDVPIVIPKLKLRDIGHQIFSADLVIGPDDAPFGAANTLLEGLSAQSQLLGVAEPLRRRLNVHAV